MASFRALQPLARAAPRLSVYQRTSKRFLNWSSDPAMYTAKAHVVGGRNGHADAQDLKVELGMPKEMGGKGGKTNPEELFAIGYGACFIGAMGATAPSIGVKLPSDPNDISIDTQVHLIGDIKKLDIGIRVDMTVTGKNIGKEDLQKLVDATKKVCPYSRATEGNVVTNLKVQTA